MNGLKMKINNYFKDKNIDFKTGLYIFAIVYYLNVMVHVLGYYVHFISTTVDCTFYAVEIVGIYIAYRSIKVIKGNEVNILCSLLKGIIIAKCIIFALLLTNGMFTILLLSSPLIIIGFEFYFYIALIKSVNRINFRYYSVMYHSEVLFDDTLKKYILLWIAYHIALVIALVIAFNVKKLWFFLCLVIIFSCKLYLQYKMIECFDQAFRRTGPLEAANNTKLKVYKFRIPKFMKNTAVKYCSLAVGALLFVIFLILKNTYSGDLYLVDENGNLATEQKAVDFMRVYDDFDNKEDIVYQYQVRNMLPWWIGYSDSKYGLLNIKTDDNTGPIYDEHLHFDIENHAWDGQGHIIDTEGNVLVTIPKSIMETRSLMQQLYDELIYKFTEIDDKYMYHYHRVDTFKEGPMRFSQYYFRDGIGVYYDDLKGKYGIINDKGELLTGPEYDYIDGSESSSNYRSRCLSAYNYYFNIYYKEYYLNNKGEVILENDKSDLVTRVNVNYTRGYISYEQDSDDHQTCETKIINFDGEIISDKYILEDDSDSNDIANAKSLDKGDTNAYAIGMGGRIIFKSDQYISYYSSCDYKGNINYLIARNKSNMYELIDLNGDHIAPGEFTDVMHPYGYGSIILCRDSGNPDYPKEIYLYTRDGKIINLLSLGSEYEKDFGYGKYYDLNQDKYLPYYWRLNTKGKYEIYSFEGILLDAVRVLDSFKEANTRPDNGDTSKYPDAVTSKYTYVDYGGYSHYAVSNERSMK